MRRRTFIQSAVGALLARAPQARAAPQSSEGIRLGYDSWTLNGYGWTAIQYLDYAAGQRLDAVQLSDLPNFESTDPAYLRTVKDHAARLGIQIDGGLGCICPTAANYRKENGDPVEWVRKGLRVNQ